MRRYVHLGCGLGETASVVAASHPNTEVWAWDEHPEHLDATRCLGEAAGLANLVVHEQRDLPLDFGGPTDMVVVQDVLVAADDGLRARIAAAVKASLRPGGLLCVTYATLAGWTEVAPVQRLLRQLALGTLTPSDDRVPEVLGVLDHLRSEGARYLTERPVVAAWLDELRTLDPTVLASRYLRDAFRPMSPAQVATTMAPVGCKRVGSAQLTDDLGLDLPPTLAAAVADAPTREPPGDVPRPGDQALVPDRPLPPRRRHPSATRARRAPRSARPRRSRRAGGAASHRGRPRRLAPAGLVRGDG